MLSVHINSIIYVLWRKKYACWSTAQTHIVYAHAVPHLLQFTLNCKFVDAVSNTRGHIGS